MGWAVINAGEEEQDGNGEEKGKEEKDDRTRDGGCVGKDWGRNPSLTLHRGAPALL